MIAAVNKARITVQGKKISKDTSAKEIEEGNKNVENCHGKSGRYGGNFTAMAGRTRCKKGEREQKEREKQLQFELKLHEAKVKLQSEITPEVSAHGSGIEHKIGVKLPKLYITKLTVPMLTGQDFGTYF